MGLETATIVSIVGAVVAAAGSAYAGYQQSEMADYNEKVAEQQAKAAQNKAKYEEDAHRERVKKILSTQKALYGASGVDTTGSPLLVMQDTTRQGEMDALAIRYGGDVAAARARSEGALAKMQGKAAAIGSYVKTGSTLLTQGYSIGQKQGWWK